MNYSTADALIISNIGSIGIAMLYVLTAVLGVALGYLAFKFGYRALMNLPGGYGYNPQYGSGMSRFRKTNYNAEGGHMKAIRF